MLGEEDPEQVLLIPTGLEVDSHIRLTRRRGQVTGFPVPLGASSTTHGGGVAQSPLKVA